MNRRRPILWFLISLACFIGAFYFWRLGDKWQAEKSRGTATPPATAPSNTAPPAAHTPLTSSSVRHESTAPVIPPLHPMTNGVIAHSTNFPYRLSNTAQGIGELVRNSKAILLENALIDSSKPLNLAIPDSLRAHGDPGSYIVQANDPIDNAFRARLAAAGLNIVSYIPNNAYLVTGTAAQVAPFGSAAIPFEPYYKIKSALMPMALGGYSASAVNVAVYPGELNPTITALNKLGVTIGSQSPSPFGTEVALQNVDVAAVANLPGIEIIEPSSPRELLNDLSRVIEGVSSDVFVSSNYLNLSGSNVVVAVADTWVPTNGATVPNPDLLNSIIAPANLFPVGFADPAGHATHVSGIIASSGNNSPTNAIGSPPGANFRGKAPLATLFALPISAPVGLPTSGGDTIQFGTLTDAELQQMAAQQTNILISNNSWGYGDTTYDLAAASYDQAVRDSIPGESGSQSLIYVFSAGNNGGGDGNGDGLGGSSDTLSSPGVSKNVITVGASMLPRNIGSNVYVCDTCIVSNGCTTNQPWLADTSSSNLVADFSSRGNVGVNVEGQFGRFKPDVVAPGTMVVSTRSMTWDTNDYDDPVTHNPVESLGNIVQTNSMFLFPALFVPCSSTQFNITAIAEFQTNFPLPIYVSPNVPPAFPGTPLGSNSVSIPPAAPLNPVDAFWFVGIGDPTNTPVTFDFFADIITTNELGNYFQVLQSMNDQLGSSNGQVLYRYESGTSMSAGSASGMLALMEDYFINTLQYTPSPALMKALLINGARSINAQYDFEVQNSINYQGWGLINLSNSVPQGLTNTALNQPSQMLFVDQSPTNALATGDSETYYVSVNPTNGAQSGNLRVTLVWTDPPGNPAASLKLVNNLQLIVTNLDASTPTNPVVFYGNDFPAGSIFTEQWDGDTTNIPYDTINNVQNVYLPFPLSTNYSITVFAKDVNVNAVTANSNGIVQDFALVVSCDDSNGLTFTTSPTAPTPSYMPDVQDLTNQFETATSAGAFLDNQLVGASSPLQGTNTLGLTNQNNWATNGQITVGVTNQWHFYVIQNVSDTNASVPFFTNALFSTFNAQELSIPPMGVNAPNISDDRPEADVDLYVARSSVIGNAYNLTNLDTNVLALCDKSLGRGGTETVVYSNAQPNEIFYVGVKSEDQEAAEYQFIALFTLAPFNNGQNVWSFYPVPDPIPAGTPNNPGFARLITYVGQSFQIQRAVVTNHLEHQNFGDLIGTLTGPDRVSVVLNNHTFGNGSTNQVFIYEDNGQGDIAGSRNSDGPGSLRNYIGQPAAGLWMLTESNSSLFYTGQVDSATLRLDRENLGGVGGSNTVVFTVQPLTYHYEAVTVPPNATNLTICVAYDSSNPLNLPLDLVIKYGNDPATDLPTLTSFDYMRVINPPAGGCISISDTSLPPLKPGTYFIGVYNPNSVPQTVDLSATIDLNIGGFNPDILVATNVPIPIIEDAVTNSLIGTNQLMSTNQNPNQIFVGSGQPIVSVNVGVVLTDPRVSDLDLTLVAPTGQRILLFENRGGFSATNMGHLNIVTNYFGQTTPGGANANTNIIGPVPTQGTLYINYNMYTVPDRMDVYYQGQDIFSTTSINPPSGLISGSNTFVIPYGPGTNDTITIVMNQGNNPVSTTQWEYTPYVVTENYTYLTFTDDTNLTDVPIKFAIPPYDNGDTGSNLFFGDFDLASNVDYIATPGTNQLIPDIAGGWNVTTNDVFVVPTNYYTGTNLISLATNFVSVITDPNTAANGSNILALANGSISRVLSLTPARNYTISYLYRGPGIAGWWRGEGNADDSADPETLGNNGDLIGRFNFPAGEVGQAFAMEDSGLAFQFAGTNTYVQVRQSPSLDVGSSNYSGFTVEGWINPTNTTFQQPLVEWLAHVPTNTIVNGQPVTNLVIEAGPFLNRANGHYYYLLGQTNWTTSELWANSLGGHLVDMDDANEEQFVYDTFESIGVSNYTLWIGLTNNPTAPNTNFFWSTGSNLVYTHWGLNEPTNCGGTPGYVAILGPTNALPGLWAVLDNNGVDCAGVSNAPFGVVEVDQIQTNGVQLWISVTNSVTNNVLTGNGRLYANIMDTNNVPHEIFSAPGLIQSNVFQHVALTYNTNTGVAQLFYNGTNVATTNLGVFVPNTGGDVLLGKDMSLVSNNFYWGLMDEMSIYGRYLSDAEIFSIYNISASTTNRNIGKFNPAITPALSLAEAQAVFGGQTNFLFGVNNTWQSAGFTIQPTSNTLPVQITGLEPGILLDSLTLSEQPPGNLYYLPEQALDELVGSNAFGTWTLEIRDSRTGLPATNAELISWELQFVLQTNTPVPAQIVAQEPFTNTIPPDEVAYFVVNVPGWANDATNILVSSQDSGGNPAPVSMLFNQNTPPLSGGPGDFTFVNNSSAGSATISAIPPTIPPLLPGQSYYLAVTNPGPNPATVVLQVDFNITTLTNGVPYLASFNTNDIERPFIFNVDSNATEATFQLMQMSGGNADLVLRQGLPIPSLTSADYGSFNGSNANEIIYVLTNSLPVNLSPGPWYLDVIKRESVTDTGVTGLAMSYAVLAKELTNTPNIIDITNRVPFTFTAGPGAALTNFFRFATNNFASVVAGNIAGIHFELYNQNGNGDLTLQTDAPPLAPPFFQSSQLPADDAEFIFIHTNATALTNLVQDWYLGVPNNETNPITYTILGVIDTNVFPSFPTAEGAGSLTRGGAFGTNVYHVTTLADSGGGSLRAAVTSTNGGGTVVFDTSGTINLLSPLYITNSFFTIAGQTAPGGNGITIAGAPTYIQDVTDIILRYLRFRPPGTNIMDSLQLTNAQNIIADHVSVAFGTNNVVSILNSSNITVQWSVLADSLNGLSTNSPLYAGTGTNPVTGGTSVRFGSGDVTLHHNLYSDNYSANPAIGEDVTLDFVNNVIYNWGLFAGLSTNDIVDNPGGVTNFLNYSANYLIAGSNSVATNEAFFGSSPDTFIFQTNNFIDTNLNMVLDGSDTSWGMFSNQFTEFSAPFQILPTAPDEAFIAYERVLDFAGTSMDKRDPMDIAQVEQVRQFGGTNVTPAFLSGMVAWWKAEDNTLDSTGNGNNGVFNGNTSYTNGEVGQAFNFDGASYVQVPDSDTLHFTNTMTVECWVNLANYSGGDPEREIVSKLAAAGLRQNVFTMGLDPGTQLAYYNVNNSNNTAGLQVRSTVTVPTNKWTHIAATCDGTAINIYINGVLSGTQPWTQGIFPGQIPLTIGCTINGTPESHFDGQIDEVSLYNRALSPCEIAAIYDAGTNGKTALLSGPGAPPVNVPPFLDTSGDGIPDFWKMTLGENLTNFDANQDRTGNGYTDLEEYLNWLGVPHALTITNTTTNVDLYTLSGKTGNLTFGVQNGTNGTVYLTNDLCEDPATPDIIAVFTPTNNFGGGSNGGFASFSYMVTNMDTVAYFGPVTVSVFVSSVPITNQAVFSFPNLPTFEMNPNTNLMVTNTATPTNGVTYQPINPPPFESINTNTGVITFDPTNGPSTNIITTVATDTNVPPTSLTNTFILIVNGPPVFDLQPPPNLTNVVGNPINVTNAATDPDMPPSDLIYQLTNPPSPFNATIASPSGVISWMPLPSQLGSNLFETIVTDTNGLSATNFFVIYVTEPVAPYAFTQPAQAVTGPTAQFNGMATPNGLISVAWFDWGTNTAYGNVTPQVNVGSGSTVVYVSAVVPGLTPNVAYHYRLTVSNSFTVVHGFDQILDEANVIVWGANFLQQSQPPLTIDNNNVSAIAGAYDHSLALLNNQTVVGWGDNTFGQINVPGGLNNVLAVAGGQYSSMALLSGGRVRAWGGNVFPVTNVPPNITNVIMIAAGTDAGLGLNNSGNVLSWGSSFSGETNVPASVNNSSNIVEVASGEFHGLAIVNDGTVIAWGDNSAGQTAVPPGLSNVVQVSGGSFHSLALRSDGTVVSWGDDSAGQTNVPPGLSNVVAVAAGGFHSMALKSDGTLVGWGDNSEGQISFPPGLTEAVAIAAGNLHSVALTPLSLASIIAPIILPTTNNAPQTNTILPGQTIFYQVNVPGNADFSTNDFGTLGGNLSMYFTTNTPPTITNLNDFELVTNAPTGSSTLTTNGNPHFIDSTTYYLGLQNTNTFAVSVGVEVTFHFFTTTTLTNTAPVSIIATNYGGTNFGFLLIWYAPSNDLFEVQWSSNFPPAWNTFTNPLPVTYNVARYTNDPSNTEFQFFDNGTETGGLSPIRYYQVILLNGSVPATVLSNSVPQTNGINGGQTAFYQITVPTNAVSASNSLIFAQGGNLNIWFSTNSPPTTGSPDDFQLMTNATSGTNVLTTNGTTPQLIDGATYYLGVQNTNSGSVIYSLAVNFGFAVTTTNSGPSTNTVPISSITVTNVGGSNAFYLVWFAPSNDLFAVQWSSNLFGPWNTFTNPLPVTYDVAKYTNNPNSAQFDFTDNGSQSGGLTSPRYYQLVLLNSSVVTNPPTTNNPTTNSVPISSVTVTNSGGSNAFYLVWFAPSNDLFAVQWSPSLFGPWNTFTNPMPVTYDVAMYTNNPNSAQFDFIDNGSQSGGLTSPRFYQLVLLNGSSASSPAVTPLVNGVPLATNTSAGQTNFFSFNITQTNAAVLFELYNLSSNAVLTLSESNLPTTPPYFATSGGGTPSTNYQQIVLRTNTTGPTNLNAISWFLGVPNTNSGTLTYTIRAVLPNTNGMLVSAVPIATTVSQSGGTNVQLAWNPTVSGETYEVRTNGNLASPNWGPLTDIVASGTSMMFTNTISPGSVPGLLYWVVQVP